MARASSVAKQALSAGIKAKVPFTITPGSEQIRYANYLLVVMLYSGPFAKSSDSCSISTSVCYIQLWQLQDVVPSGVLAQGEILSVQCLGACDSHLRFYQITPWPDSIDCNAITVS